MSMGEGIPAINVCDIELMEKVERPEKPEDRRKYLREPIIIFKVTEEDERRYLFGYAKNISRGGLFISSINPRKSGERFHITFEIPRTDIRVRCLCEVVWTRKYDPGSKLEPGYGIRFLDLPDETAEAINRWVLEPSRL